MIIYIYIYMIHISSIIWFVVWNIYIYMYWECHEPKCRSEIFQRVGLNHLAQFDIVEAGPIM